jgi:hypothetical protein
VKVLLDEDLPHKLRLAIPNHDVSTVAYLGWAGLKNGKLLKATEDAGFEVFVTADKKMSKQQNLSGRLLAVVVLSTLDWEIMKPHLGRIASAIDVAVPGGFHEVDCGEFRR